MEITKTLHPATCLCPLCVADQFEGVERCDRSEIASQMVAASSVDELRRLPVESRARLREALSLGYSPGKERDALEKILMADLLAQIKETELVVSEYQPGLVIRGGPGIR